MRHYINLQITIEDDKPSKFIESNIREMLKQNKIYNYKMSIVSEDIKK